MEKEFNKLVEWKLNETKVKKEFNLKQKEWKCKMNSGNWERITRNSSEEIQNQMLKEKQKLEQSWIDELMK